VFLTNPPYGERLGDEKAAAEAAQVLRALWDKHSGFRLYALSGHAGFERCFRRKADTKRRVYNGRLECALYGYQNARKDKAFELD